MLLTWAQTPLYAAILGLFSSGANGVFLDANDWANVCFQDAAGTTPVTAMEQPVGLILDKSQGVAPTANLITPAANSTFASDTGYWNKNTGVTISGGALVFTATADTFGASHAGVCTPGLKYKITYTILSISAGGIQVECGGTLTTVRSTTGTFVETVVCGSTGSGRIYPWSVGASTTASITNLTVQQVGSSNYAYQTTAANRPIITARYNLLTATSTLSTQSVTTVATNYVLYFTGSGTVTLSGTATGTKSAGSNTITCTAGTLTLTVSGSVLTADLRPADQAVGLLPQYQSVTDSTTYTTAGFPVLIKGNGSNQFLQGNLDLSGTNKVTVWMGVRKIDTTSSRCFVHLSDTILTNNGAFYINGPDSGNDYAFDAKGTIENYQATSPYVPPITNTLCMAADIGATSLKGYVNGVLKVNSSASMGTGNFGSYPYYVLSRAGTGRFQSGGFNSLIILGAAATAAQISTTEAYCNQKLRAY